MPRSSPASVRLRRRSSLNLQVQLAVHVSQGVAGQAGDELAGAGHPRPTHLLPLHSGAGPDFTVGVEKKTRFIGRTGGSGLLLGSERRDGACAPSCRRRW